MSKEKGILIETGTNEFEIVEFSVGNVSYGINVAKVREVIRNVPIKTLPQAHPWVEGIFSLRGKVMPLVSLPRVLGSDDDVNEFRIIVSELNGVLLGFKADQVSRIHRISWTQMETPQAIANSELAVGIIKMENRMIILLDFERILSEISPEVSRRLSTVPESQSDILAARSKISILIAEDSKTLRELLTRTLTLAGYSKLTVKENGQQAWQYIEGACASGNQLDLIITDIEMPQMDGHYLIKLVKAHPQACKIPTVIFSSLINESMKRKGEAIGADAQITKPEIDKLIEAVDILCNIQKRE